MDRLQLLSPIQSRVPFQVEVGTIQFSESASRECSPYRQTAARTKQREGEKERTRERGFLGLPSIFAALRKERPLPREGEEEGARVSQSDSQTASHTASQRVQYPYEDTILLQHSGKQKLLYESTLFYGEKSKLI